MENKENMKAVFIIVNAGFSEEVVTIARNCGARGATIINARGTGHSHAHFLGMSYDPEKEMVISIVKKDIAEKILDEIKLHAGMQTQSQGICFSMPVDDMTSLNYQEDLK